MYSIAAPETAFIRTFYRFGLTLHLDELSIAGPINATVRQQ